MPKEDTRTALAVVGVWRVVVLNDPANLMSCVVLVFVQCFDEPTARRKMLEVHEWAVRWSERTAGKGGGLCVHAATMAPDHHPRSPMKRIEVRPRCRSPAPLLDVIKELATTCGRTQRRRSCWRDLDAEFRARPGCRS